MLLIAIVSSAEDRNESQTIPQTSSRASGDERCLEDVVHADVLLKVDSNLQSTLYSLTHLFSSYLLDRFLLEKRQCPERLV